MPTAKRSNSCFPARQRRPALAALVVLVAAGAALVSPLGAQILKLPPKRSQEPAYWFGGNLGYLDQQSVVDGETGTVWVFGGALQFRGFAEYSLGRGSSVGVAGTYARMPLVYEVFTGTTPLPGGATSVDAHADLWSLMATFHAGGGEGFHYVIDAGVGAARFARFRADGGDDKLPPTSDTDFAFSIGTGIGYSPSPRTEFFLVQDYGSVFHQRAGLPNDTRAQAQQLTTRLGARFGSGARRLR